MASIYYLSSWFARDIIAGMGLQEQFMNIRLGPSGIAWEIPDQPSGIGTASSKPSTMPWNLSHGASRSLCLRTMIELPAQKRSYSTCGRRILVAPRAAATAPPSFGAYRDRESLCVIGAFCTDAHSFDQTHDVEYVYVDDIAAMADHSSTDDHAAQRLCRFIKYRGPADSCDCGKLRFVKYCRRSAQNRIVTSWGVIAEFW
jgi:hypothetical protein